MDLKMKKKILSKSFYNLNLYAFKNKIKYINSKPYPHIVIKNFFNSNF